MPKQRKCNCCGGKLERNRITYCTRCSNVRGYNALSSGKPWAQSECWHDTQKVEKRTTNAQN